MEKITAIVLAAGSGSRMNTKIHKQYLMLCGKPVLYYALKAFEESAADSVVLVVGRGEISYCKTEIVGKYGFSKVRAVVEGGKERYHSVYEGLKQASGSAYALIHDGARPLVTQDIIARAIGGAKRYGACVTGMPVKDTIKIADENGVAVATPDRRTLWQIQTPQAFSYPLILEAYEKVIASGESGVTDDAMVLERASGRRAHIVEGSYRNIKITTQEDLPVAEAYLRGCF